MIKALYRQAEDKFYTLTAYRKAKEDGAHALAKRIRWANKSLANRIRWANESLTTEFDLIDKQVALIPVNRSEGWES